MQKADPIFCFGSLLQSDIQLCEKIGFTLGLLGFGYIGTNAGAATQKLPGHNRFVMKLTKIFAGFDNTH